VAPHGRPEGWLIVTRDRRIQDHRAEIEAVRSNDARMVALAGKEAVGTWSQLEVFMCQWRAIEQCLAEPGPFIYNATRTALRSVPLTWRDPEPGRQHAAAGPGAAASKYGPGPCPNTGPASRPSSTTR
jgi:PIN like domain